jgi:hypothetical protein
MVMQERRKPLGMKNYGHIAHLPGSRMGLGDHSCELGQARIATVKARDRHDHIVVQEKLDGTNVGVARVNGVLYPLVRAGYIADTSPFEQHWRFAQWVYANQDRFLAVLRDGERLVGEWLMQAHSTRYQLTHEPFVAFDLMVVDRRTRYDEFINRVSQANFVTPALLHRGGPISIEVTMAKLETHGFHGALDPVEGAVWRVERNELTSPGKSGEREWRVDFLVKYVRPEKLDGVYLPEISGCEAVWNWREEHPQG